MQESLETGPKNSLDALVRRECLGATFSLLIPASFKIVPELEELAHARNAMELWVSPAEDRFIEIISVPVPLLTAPSIQALLMQANGDLQRNGHVTTAELKEVNGLKLGIIESVSKVYNVKTLLLIEKSPVARVILVSSQCLLRDKPKWELIFKKIASSVQVL